MAYMFRKYEIYVYMFAGCSSLKQINFHSFVTNNVKFINGLFYDCEALEELDISNFVTSLSKREFMFYHLKPIKTLNIANFTTTKVEYMNYIFKTNIKNFDGMFSGCSI